MGKSREQESHEINKRQSRVRAGVLTVLFLASMLFTSPVAFVVKPASIFKTEYGRTCLFMSYHHQTLTENHNQSHDEPCHFKEQILSMYKAYRRGLDFSVCQEIWAAMGGWLTFIC